jgi:hypothetical protein
LAPKGVLEQISRNIKYFWEGGKSNTKKFHLINWPTVCQPMDKGGLAIRETSLMNIALGAKIAWRLVTGNSDWWKCTLLSRYFNRSRL